MSADRSLAELLGRPGTWTTVYVDGTGGEPQSVEEAKQDGVVRRLAEAGASEKDRRAVAEALRDATGVASPSARYLLVREGEVVIDEWFADARRGPEIVASGALALLVPLLRHRGSSHRYLVVETTRDGADLRVERAGAPRAERRTSVEGSTDALPKVQAGGWSHARWQRHSEEVWKHNQSEIAAEVDRLVRETRPAFIALAGDLRARQLLRERLSPESLELLVEADANTRADGADDERLEQAVSAALDEVNARRIREALAVADADDGARRAKGTDEVVAALQQARVDELVIDALLLETDETLEALDAEPWLDGGAGAPGAASSLGPVPLPEALARAAVLTGARVRIVEESDDAERDGGGAEGEGADGAEARPRRGAHPPLAVLRWANREEAPRAPGEGDGGDARA